MTANRLPCRLIPALRAGPPIIFGLAAALVAGSAVASPGPAAASPDPSGQVEQICRDVMGVRPGEAHYVDCVARLSSAARTLGRGRALAEAGDACRARGLKPGDADFDVCEVRDSQARGSAAATPAAASADANLKPSPVKSYFYASPGEIFQREQLACARLGLDPAGQGFARCVAGLQAAMFADDNPQN